MSNRTKYVGGAVAVVLLWWLLPIPGWVTLVALAVLIGVPVVGYLMLDDSQRRRLRRIRRREIGR